MPKCGQILVTVCEKDSKSLNGPGLTVMSVFDENTSHDFCTLMTAILVVAF